MTARQMLASQLANIGSKCQRCICSRCSVGSCQQSPEDVRATRANLRQRVLGGGFGKASAKDGLHTEMDGATGAQQVVTPWDVL